MDEVTRCARALESRGWEVERLSEGRYAARSRGFLDAGERLLLSAGRGGARFAPDYGSPGQLAMHLAGAAFFAWEAWFGRVSAPWAFAAAMVLVQAVPPLTAWAYCRRVARGLVTPAPVRAISSD